MFGKTETTYRGGLRGLKPQARCPEVVVLLRWIIDPPILLRSKEAALTTSVIHPLLLCPFLFLVLLGEVVCHHQTL